MLQRSAVPHQPRPAAAATCVQQQPLQKSVPALESSAAQQTQSGRCLSCRPRRHVAARAASPIQSPQQQWQALSSIVWEGSEQVQEVGKCRLAICLVETPPTRDQKRPKLTDSDVCTQEALQEAAPLSREHPLWRLLLLSDGSVTRHLQLLTGSAVRVDCLAMAPAVEESAELPPAVEALAHPLLQREVHHSLPWTWLRCRLASAGLSYIVYMDVLKLSRGAL